MKGGLALIVLAFASATPLAQQVFRSGAEAVRVDVLVTDGRKPVGDLTATDFEVRDSGVPQRIDSVNLDDVPLSVLLVLDVSYSMHGEPLAHLKDAASAVIDLLRPADRAAILTFSEKLQLAARWTSDRSELKHAFEGIEARGSTSLYDAAYSALTLRDPLPGRPLVLIFSDGHDTLSWLPGQAVLDTARRSEAVVYGVGLKMDATLVPGYRLDFRSGPQPVRRIVSPSLMVEELLPHLAADTGGKHLNAQRSAALRDAFVQIVSEFRTRYLITYTPQGVEKGGWHPIGVKLKNKAGKVTARRGYLR